MHVSSRFAAWQVFALAILITLGGIGAPSLQAQDQSQGAYCPPKPSCTVTVPDCPVQRLEKPCAPPQCETCCPVDPKEVKKAQKNADHAAHEAAEACRRQQRAAAKANHEIEEAYDRQNRRIDSAHEKWEQRRAEYADALSKSATLNAQQQQQQAATTVECPAKEAECPAPEVRTKPEPVPVTPEPRLEETPSVTPAPEPAPAPETAPPISQVQPKELPKTASPLELIGLIGIASSITGYMGRFFRG